MDPKAAAKSKRSQSLHGRRNHPTPSAANAQKKKEPPSQSKQPNHGGVQSRRRGGHHHNLPSNWDRYSDDDDAVVRVEDGGSDPVRREVRKPAAKVTQPMASGGDSVAPKSKGADFGYLIEQARSQPRDRRYGDGGLASASLFDETVPDCVEGLISIISAKGEGLLSWCSNDNFIVDNDAGSSFEVPFLSMDVHALASQLSKLNMSQRLFIEEDMLSTELHVDRLNEHSIQRFDNVETQNLTESEHCLAEDAFPGSKNEQVADGQSKSSQSKTVEGYNSMQTSGKRVSPLFSQGQGIKQDLINSLESLDWGSKRQGGESGSHPDMTSIQGSAARIESAAAEAELDNLLDSFGVINDFASSSLGSSTSMRNNVLDRLIPMDAVSSRQESSSLSKAGTDFGDAVDEILFESHASFSQGMHVEFGITSTTQVNPCELSTGVGVGTAGPGFSDSKHIVPLEKSIDDLLAETSFFNSCIMYDQGDGGSAQVRPHGSSVRMDVPHPREDHASRHTALTTSLDETIDDLLAETSSHLKNQVPSPHPHEKSHVL